MNDNVRTHVIVNLIRTITITLVSFISFPFAAKALGDIGMGEYTFANTFVYYFLIIAKLGIPSVAIRECTKVRDDKEQLSIKTQQFFLLQLITTLLSFGFMIGLMFLVGGPFSEQRIQSLIFLLSLNFLVGAFSFEWLYIALEKHFYIAFRSIITLTLTSILIIIFIKSDRQIYLYALLTISTTIITSLINMTQLKRFGISLKPLTSFPLFKTVKPLLAVFAITIMVTMYNQTDALILGFLDPSKADVGSYSVGIKGIEIVITIITSLSAVFIPRATHYYQVENKVFFKNLTRYSMNICLFIAVPAVITMIMLSPQITAFIALDDNGYWDVASLQNATWAIVILASMALTYSISDIIYSQVLLPMKKEKIYLYTMIFGVIFNLSLSLLFAFFVFSHNPMIGVALATIIADVLVMIMMLIVTRKYTFQAVLNWNSLKLLLAGVLVAITTYFVLPLFANEPSLNQIIYVLIIDAMVYVSVLLLSKENLVSSFLPSHQTAQE